MGSDSFLVFVLVVERQGTNTLVKASGPLGTVQSEVSSEAVAGLKSATLKDVPRREQGTRLFEALFQGQIRGALLQHRSQAQKEGKPLRLIVRLPQEADVSDWPLEFLHDARTGEDLALEPSVTITRENSQWPSPRAVEMLLPVRILVVIPEPTDAQPFGAQALWESLEAAMHPLTSRGQARIARTASGTERSLDESLRAEPWHIIHFMGQGTSRPAARYGTLNFEGSDRRTRAVNAQNFVRLCEKYPSLGLAVLQATQHQPPRQAFEVVTNTWLENGLGGVTWMPDFSQPQVSALFARELYGALAQGQRLDQAVASGRRAMAAVAPQPPAGTQRSGIDLGYWGGPVLFGGQPALDFGLASTSVSATTRTTQTESPPPQSSQYSPTPEEKQAPPGPTPVQREVERKRLAEQFDVFLCHNIADKPAVKEIGLKLVDQGIVPWLDEWELRPGVPWQRLLEEQIAKIKSAAVFVGREGIGPWQRQELDGFLREFATRNCPVIPVLLPGAPVQPSLPRFLMGMTWVDFRVSQPDPLARLIWGITGKRPEIG